MYYYILDRTTASSRTARISFQWNALNQKPSSCCSHSRVHVCNRTATSYAFLAISFPFDTASCFLAIICYLVIKADDIGSRDAQHLFRRKSHSTAPKLRSCCGSLVFLAVCTVLILWPYSLAYQILYLYAAYGIGRLPTWGSLSCTRAERLICTCGGRLW